MGFVLLRLFAVRLAFFRDDDDDDDVLRSDDMMMMMMMMKEKSGSRYDSSVSTFADVDVLFARSTKAARVLSLSIERDLLLLSKTDRRRREGKALVPGGSSRMVVSDFHSRY
jgi:hypothetical protein